MKTWYNVTLEDLILPEGGNNQELIDQLNLVEYLDEIDDLVDWGINDDPVPAREQIKAMFMKIFLEMSRVMGNAGKTDPKDTEAYLGSTYVTDATERILKLSMSVTRETWPEVRKKLLEDAGIVDDRLDGRDTPMDPRFIDGFEIM